MSQVFFDILDPAIPPFGSPTLVLPKFDVAVYAALEGVDPSRISLVGVELQAELSILEASVQIDNLGPACNAAWSLNLAAAVPANPTFGTPTLGGLFVLNLADQAILPPANGGPPPWDYEWLLSVDGGGPLILSDCYSMTTALDAWVASSGSNTANFAMNAAASSQFDTSGCGGTLTAASNTSTMTLSVRYHYCVNNADPVPGAFCFGSGAGSPCPCGNENDGSQSCGFAGCANSSSAGGASLGVGGSFSVTLDDFELWASGLVPGQPGLYFQGLNAVAGGAGSSFGDGLRCAGGSVVRLAVRVADGSGLSNTQGLGLALLGGVLAGDVRRYQLWYRDPGSSPCGTGFNLTNGVEVSWMP